MATREFPTSWRDSPAIAGGLQAGLFTGSLEHGLRTVEELEVGGVIVNDVPTWRTIMCRTAG